MSTAGPPQGEDPPPGVVRLVSGPVLVAGLIFLAVSVFVVLQMRGQWEAQERSRIESTLLDHVQLSVEQEIITLTFALERFAADPGVAEALIARDRQKALERAMPYADRYRTRLGATHLYLHGLDGICFIRAHQPDRFGDGITRQTLAQARFTGGSVGGLEVGPLGTLTVRVVRPIRRGGEVVGYAEVGTDVEVLTRRISRVIGRQVGVFVAKAFLDQARWMAMRKATRADWARLPEHVPDAGAQGLIDPFQTGSGISIPLRDMQSRVVAQVVAAPDLNTLQKATWRAAVVAIAAFICLAAALALFMRRGLQSVEVRLEAGARRDAEVREELARQVKARTDALEAEVQERMAAEARLRHAQRLEAIGQLTGGIAHDFNNALTVIGSNLVLAQEEPSSEMARECIEDAMAAIDSTAALTRRLLAFSRRQALRPQAVELNEHVRGVSRLVARTLGDEMHLVVETMEEPLHVLADPVQLESCILNLVINARDAMSDGGQVTLKVAPRQVGPEAEGELAVGAYGVLSVEDTGSGIAPEHLQHVFEPFFTTKPVGQGTGMGLSMVYGFARQSHGDVRIQSELKVGTSIALLLPQTAPAERRRERPRHASVNLEGVRVLLVEDQPSVRQLAEQVLRRVGCVVHAVAEAEAAEAILKSERPLDLMFSDVVLGPGATGADLARLALEVRPEMPVLLTTGYAAEATEAIEQLGLPLLEKPYTSVIMLNMVSEVLSGELSGRQGAHPAAPIQG